MPYMIDKKLKHDSVMDDIPVYGLAMEQEGQINVWAFNDTQENVKFGIYWFIADPDGMVTKEYEDWEFGSTGPSDDHHFDGPGFNIVREKYTCWIELFEHRLQLQKGQLVSLLELS